MIKSDALVDIIQVGNTLGEGVQWNAADGCAWWTDIQERRLYRWRMRDADLSVLPMPERVGSFAFTAQDDELIVAFESGIAQHCLSAGQSRWLVRPEAGRTGRRFNDGRADRQGRFWAGTMVEDERTAGRGSASLWRIDAQGSAHKHIAGIQISNGLCFSPDSRHCYFSDSPTGLIFRFDFDADSGRMSSRRVFAEAPPGGCPDGATVDSDGCLWSAQWGSGQVIRYSPDGRIDRTLCVPTRHPTCPAFGGPHLDLLFVTSAREGLTAKILQDERMAGHVFVFQVENTGLIEPRYGGGHQENPCASPSRRI